MNSRINLETQDFNSDQRTFEGFFTSLVFVILSSDSVQLYFQVINYFVSASYRINAKIFFFKFFILQPATVKTWLFEWEDI